MTQRFTKTVDIKTVDEESRTATGAVLVPNELDHQLDFLRPGAIQRFHAENPDTGVMHSAFPEGAAELTRHEIIDEAETIGGEEFPAGTEVATRKYHDDELWSLVSDGILTGFSIGGEIRAATEHDSVPEDVRVPDGVEYDGEQPVTELLNGTVDEISDVDIPAVPRARYKGDTMGKSLLEEVENEAEFVELMVEQRGHEEAEARRLYQYLMSQKSLTRRELLEVAKSGEGKPGDTFEECVEIIMEERDVSEEDAREICGALEDEEDNQNMTDTSDDEPDDATKWRRFKSWLSSTDDGVSSEDLDGQKASDEEGGEEDDEDEEEDEDMEDKHATEGDTSGSDMTDDDTNKSDDPPEWAESLTEKVEQINERVDKLEDDGDNDGAEESMKDAPEWASDLAEKVDDLDERVDAISKQSGHSQQLDATQKNETDADDEVEAFKAQLVGGRTGGD